MSNGLSEGRIRRGNPRAMHRAAFACCLIGASTIGCGAFGPGFLNLLDGGQGRFQTLENAPGHVVIQVVNNTEVDERLLAFLAPRLNLTDAQRRSLRPRIRMRLRIIFVDGTFQVIEFVTGSRNFVDPTFDAQAFPDLNQNDLNNAVVLCNVAGVQLEPNSNVEVFVPVELVGYELVEFTTPQGGVATTFEIRQRIAPQFSPLLVDEVDANGNLVLQRNVGIRNVLTPTPNVICGSVVAVTIAGVLNVPFLDGVADVPSFDLEDEPTIGRIGGRYEFRLAIQ